MTYKAEIIADSLAENGVRLTTMQVTFPRFILAEFNTHRAFSRNSASSRAIPISKRIKEVQENMFIPEKFTANQKGMQGGEPLTGKEEREARAAWIAGACHAATYASRMDTAGVHKQYANRLLEPFLWHTAVVTATDWNNFFAQRCHPDAQPEIRTIAEMMRDALGTSIQQELPVREWHLPYITEEDRELSICRTYLKYISVARCARVSYLSQDGKRDAHADVELYKRLLDGNHWSPFEHVATPAAKAEHQSGNFRGWVQFRKTFTGECR